MARIGTAFIEISGDFGPLRRQLAQQQFGRDLSIKVKADVDRSSFARAEAAGGRLGGTEEVKLKADIDTSSFARARAAEAVLTKESAKLGDVFNRSNLSIGQWTGILAAAAPVILDAAGALGALTASLAAATAGLAALGAGFISAGAVGFGGIAAIAAPAIKSLQDLMTAQTAANKARATGAQSAARSQAAANQQIRTSTEAVTAAEGQLKVAQETEAQAQKALTQARFDAVRQLEDMKRAALESGTSEKRARLSILEAEANLRQLRASGTASVLDIRDAELSITEARQNAKDVSIQAQRAQQDYNKAQRQGIDQMPGVVSAQQSLDSATRGVADAQTAVAKATQNLAFQQRQANTATVAGGTSLAALALAQKKAGPAAVKFAASLKDLSRRWKELTAVGKADFFGALNDGLDILNKRLPMFARSANESTSAARDAFNRFFTEITSGPEFTRFINVMTDTFARAIGPIADAFANIGKVIERVAVAVAPDVVRMARGFNEITKGWVDSTRNADNLQHVVHQLVNQTVTWLKLIKAATQLIIAVLVPGMGQGQKAVKGITATLQEWTAWVRAHPAEMRDFFKQGLETTKELFQVLLGFIPTLFQISTAMRPIARAFLGILKGLNSLKIGNVSALTVLLGAMVGAKVVKGVAGLVLGFKSLATALGAVRVAEGAATAEVAASTVPSVGAAVQSARAMKALPGARVGAGAAATAFPFAGMGEAFQGAEGVTKATASLSQFLKVAGGVTLAITALVGAVEALRTNFLGVRSVFEGFFARVLKPLAAAFKDLLNTVSGGHAGEVFGAFGKALQAIARPLAFVVRNLTKFIGLLAIGAISSGFVLAITAMAAPVYVFVKALTLLIRTLRRLPDVAKAIGTTLVNVFTASWRQIKQVFQAGIGVALGAFKRFAGSIHDVVSGIGHVFRGLYLVIKKIATWIGNQINKVGNALGGIKSKIPDLGVNLPNPLDLIPSVPGFRTGGLAGMVPGSAPGDRHVLTLGGRPIAKVESQEGIFVGNRNLMALLEKMNAKVPRFAKGGMAAMVAEANRFESHHFPYQWGGGHGGFGIQPVDCSGAVSDVLHAAGLLRAPMVSGALAHWGKAGKGPLTVYANPAHTFMSLSGRYFGTSSTNPGGGAGWIEGGYPRSYLAQFAARTMGVLGAAIGQIKRAIVKGSGPLRDVGQAASDRMRKIANRYIASLAPAGTFGGGQSLKDFPKGPGRIVGASVYGFGEPGTGTVGASGVSLPGKLAFAELDMGTALGGLSFGKKLGIAVGHKQAIGEKLDIGAGGGDVDGHHRAIDFWRDLALALGLSGTFLGLAKVKGLQKGGLPNLSIGGIVPGPIGAPVKIMAHGGEEVIPHMQRGGTLSRLQEQAERVRKRVREVEKKLEQERGSKDPDKGLIKHLKDHARELQTNSEKLTELIAEQKVNHSDSKERNRLLRAIQQNERGGMRAVSDYVASDIGYRQRQKTRQAAAGSVARY